MSDSNLENRSAIPAGPLFQSAIQRIIPHRHPFLLVDRVTDFVPGVRISGVKQFTVNEPGAQAFASHAAQIPAGFLIEALSQLGAILVLERPEMAGKVAVILQIPVARLHHPVFAGDTVQLEAEAVKLRSLGGEMRGRALVAGKLVAEGQMRFAVANAADLLPAK
jgi:3-hydroxymyristoyl/3-hydroxydecanoyl-(acyl carrier protein) dehydratase